MARTKKEKINEEVKKEETVNNDLVKFLISNSNSKFISTIEKSEYFNRKEDFVDTKIPMLNVALSGQIDGGLPSNSIISIVGKPKHYKTMYALYIVKAYLDKYPDAICLFADTEGGAGKKYFENVNINPSKIVWLPCENIEEMKTELSMKLDALKKANNSNTKVIIFIDSLGNVASSKEIKDANEGNNVTDLTRAKQIKSLFRIITLPAKLLNVPIICVNHVYSSQSFIPEDKISGGEGSIYNSDSIIMVSKRQIKNSDNELEGFTFELNINRSRYVKEKSKLPIDTFYGEGLIPYSGLSELALEFGIVESIKVGRSKGLKFGDMEILEKENGFDSEFWETVIAKSNLKELIKQKFSLEKKDRETIDETEEVTEIEE